jgi:hypothetical protein
VDEFDARTGVSSETASPGTLKRGVVIEELRLVYVPVSKAACTSLRWLLADLIGLPPESFEDPAKFRATQGQTIQNVHKWPPQYIVQRADPGWLEEVAEDDNWFRFSVVRDPARRLWSAWQSKLLLRQPGFVEAFGGESWFPGIPSSAEEVLESYERFVAALEREDEDRRPSDSHWKLQTELLGDAAPALNHIGRVEALGDTLKLLGEHVAPFGKELPPMRRENVTPLPYPGGLLSEETARVIREYYAPDYRAFDYPEPEASPPSEEAARGWKERAGILLDSVRLLISHNERLNTLNESMQDARREAATTRKNSEGLRREAAKRDKQVVRFRNRANSLEGQVESLEGQVESLEGQVESLEGQVESLEGQVGSLRESLQKIQGSGTWRYTAPARRLIEEARRAKGRLQGGGTPG